MAEQLLDVAQAGTSSQQVRRAAVAEGVNTGFELGLLGVLIDSLPDHLIGQSPTFFSVLT